MASASSPAGHAPARPRPGARLPPDRSPPDGPAYLRIVRADGVSMAAASVFGVRRQINAVAGDVASAKVTRGGSLLIQTITKSQNEALLGLRHFLGKPCEVTVAEDPNTTEGLIHCPQLRDISEESILYELEPQGVCEVQRLRSKVAGEINPLIRLRFRGEALPTRIFCGYLSVQVRPWIPGAPAVPQLLGLRPRQSVLPPAPYNLRPLRREPRHRRLHRRLPVLPVRRPSSRVGPRLPHPADGAERHRAASCRQPRTADDP